MNIIPIFSSQLFFNGGDSIGKIHSWKILVPTLPEMLDGLFENLDKFVTSLGKKMNGFCMIMVIYQDSRGVHHEFHWYLIGTSPDTGERKNNFQQGLQWQQKSHYRERMQKRRLLLSRNWMKAIGALKLLGAECSHLFHRGNCNEPFHNLNFAVLVGNGLAIMPPRQTKQQPRQTN
jgi:hypothetical protein